MQTRKSYEEYSARPTMLIWRGTVRRGKYDRIAEILQEVFGTDYDVN
jgi:hypothetical protein